MTTAVVAVTIVNVSISFSLGSPKRAKDTMKVQLPNIVSAQLQSTVLIMFYIEACLVYLPIATVGQGIAHWI